jgi:hypothetical protein
MTRLREIANDPNGFLLSQGLSGLDFSDETELAKLRQLYETLQTRILDMLDALQTLRESAGYELYQLSQQRPELVQEQAARTVIKPITTERTSWLALTQESDPERRLMQGNRQSRDFGSREK